MVRNNMCPISIQNNSEQYKKQNILVKAGAVVAGGAVYNTAKYALTRNFCKPLARGITKYSKEADSVVLNKAVNAVSKEPAFADLTIIDFDKIPKIKAPKLEEHVKDFHASIPPKYINRNSYPKEMLEQDVIVSNKLKNIYPKWAKPFESMRNFYTQEVRYAIQEGRTAMAFSDKKILVNLKKLQAATFHEIGHLMDPKFNHAAKKMKKALPYIVWGSLLTTKKTEGEGYKNKFDKFIGILRNNAPLAAMGVLAPLVGTEILASYKGEKLVKPHIDAKTLNSVKNLNCCAAATYIVSLLATGASLWAALKVKDIITAPSRHKNIQKV